MRLLAFACTYTYYPVVKLMRKAYFQLCCSFELRWYTFAGDWQELLVFTSTMKQIRIPYIDLVGFIKFYMTLGDSFALYVSIMVFIKYSCDFIGNSLNEFVEVCKCVCAELSGEDLERNTFWSWKNLLNQVETDNSAMILDYITHFRHKTIQCIGNNFVKFKAS